MKSDKKELREKKVFVRMTKDELDQIKQNAKLFEQGNMSKWIRERALDVSVRLDEKTKDS